MTTPAPETVAVRSSANDAAREREPFLHIESPGKRGNDPRDRTEHFDAIITLGGELSVATLPGLWRQAETSLRQTGARRFGIDVSRVTCQDSSCLALIAEIRRLVAIGGGEAKVVNGTEALRSLIDLAMLPDALAPGLRPPRAFGFVTRLGEMTFNGFRELKALVTFVGELCAGFAWAVAHPQRVRWRDFVLSFEKTGADATPVVVLLGLLIGVMLAFQSAEQTERYGVRTVVPSVVAIAVTRELGPLIATLLIAGRTGSAYAAELGTMKVNQELSALRTMGLDPVRFLVVPRVLAALLAAPLLTAFCDIAGVLGGYTVMADHGFSFVHYLVQAHNALNWSDVLGGAGKTVVFGGIIGAIGCQCGLNTGSGPRAVGESTTRAVVIAILLLVAADGFFGVVFYYFGI